MRQGLQSSRDCKNMRRFFFAVKMSLKLKKIERIFQSLAIKTSISLAFGPHWSTAVESVSHWNTQCQSVARWKNGDVYVRSCCANYVSCFCKSFFGSWKKRQLLVRQWFVAIIAIVYFIVQELATAKIELDKAEEKYQMARETADRERQQTRDDLEKIRNQLKILQWVISCTAVCCRPFLSVYGWLLYKKLLSHLYWPVEPLLTPDAGNEALSYGIIALFV